MEETFLKHCILLRSFVDVYYSI